MTKTNYKTIALTLGLIGFSFLFVWYIFAFTEPTSPPPTGNVPAPLNVGSTAQSKTGWLTVGSTVSPSYTLDVQGTGGALGALRTTGGAILNTGGASTGLIVRYGNVGIGTTTPAYKLDVQGGPTNAIQGISTGTYGVRGAGRIYGVYGSGIYGVYGYGTYGLYGYGTTYGVVGIGSGGSYGIYAVGGKNYFAGNVGIGTTTPAAKLHVASGDIIAGAPGEEYIFHTRSANGGDFLQITDRDDGGGWKWEQGITLTQDGKVAIHRMPPPAARARLQVYDGGLEVRAYDPDFTGQAALYINNEAGGEDFYHHFWQIEQHPFVAAGSPDSEALFFRWAEGGFVTEKMILRKNGDLVVTGTIAAASKAFLIDHPLDSNKKLSHATLEGPENAVFYRGEAQLSNGRATIFLPNYFEALTRKENRTVLLTPKFEGEEPISQLAASEVKNGKFQVRALDTNNPNQKFFWEVKAVRADVELLKVEVEK